MKISRRRFIAITAAAGAAGISAPRTTRAAASWKGVALGARAQIHLLGISEDLAGNLLQRTNAEIVRLEKQFSLYDSESALSNLNRTGKLANPSPDMLKLASLVSSLHLKTGGVFDPTVQPLWTTYARHAGKPSSREINDALEKTGWQKVLVAPNEISLPAGGALTFNGIAQGYITDQVVNLLRSEGLRNALVDVGEISAMGKPVNATGWNVHLGKHNGPVHMLSNRAAATTAPAGTVFSSGGESHLINPTTGIPVRSPWKNVTVIHDSAAFADGLSTALAQMEFNEVKVIIESLGNVAFSGQHQELGRVTIKSG